MTTKLKNVTVPLVFILLLFLGLRAESIPDPGGQDNIEKIAKKVFRSVVKVIAKNGINRVATGVVVDKNGYIVTHALISPRHESILVVTPDGKKIEADFLGMDPVTHLALIQAKDKNLIPISIGKSKQLSHGSWIGVISFSEKTPAITQGIVSSISPEALRLNVWTVPGSSGSPVVDRNGRMVGLIRGAYIEDRPVVIEFKEKSLVASGFMFSKAEAPSSGLAKAVPVEVVTEVSSEIKKEGRVRRGWLGVSTDEDEEGRVMIIGIDGESPAELAELKRGDIVLEFEGKEVTSFEMLRDEIRKRKPGEGVTLKIERNGKTRNVKVRLGEYSEEEGWREFEFKFPRLFPTPRPPISPRPPVSPKPPVLRTPRVFSWGLEQKKFIGVYLQPLNRELSEYFGVEKGMGLLIATIREDSPAEKVGLKIGDVIVKADGVRVQRAEQLSRIIQGKEKGNRIKIEFLRNKKKRTVEVEVEEEEKSSFIRFDNRDGWEDYVEHWDDYGTSLRKQYKAWGDRYFQDYQNWTKKLKKHLEESARKSTEATQRLLRSLKTYKVVKG
ncbi:MAG: PDZ domain-containing protein [Candidatus Aminicenantes bacterium]|nr:PDZ domain-containing protein [Candidatus Aminicenantes bacterium]